MDNDVSMETPNVDIHPYGATGLYSEEYPSVNKTFGYGTSFLNQFNGDSFMHMQKDNVYYPFASFDDWEMGLWLLHSRLSMAAIDSFLSLKIVSIVRITREYVDKYIFRF